MTDEKLGRKVVKVMQLEPSTAESDKAARERTDEVVYMWWYGSAETISHLPAKLLNAVPQNDEWSGSRKYDSESQAYEALGKAYRKLMEES